MKVVDRKVRKKRGQARKPVEGNERCKEMKKSVIGETESQQLSHPQSARQLSLTPALARTLPQVHACVRSPERGFQLFSKGRLTGLEHKFGWFISESFLFVYKGSPQA